MIVTRMCANLIIGGQSVLLNRAERMHSISGRPALIYRAVCSFGSEYTKYEQIISQVEGHAYSLTFSSSGSEAIKQSLLSVAAGMRKEKERLKSCGEALHKIVHIYETTENKVIESTQQVKPVGQNLPVGITGKALLTEKT